LQSRLHSNATKTAPRQGKILGSGILKLEIIGDKTLLPSSAKCLPCSISAKGSAKLMVKKKRKLILFPRKLLLYFIPKMFVSLE
jgi:hypothetical protein